MIKYLDDDLSIDKVKDRLNFINITDEEKKILEKLLSVLKNIEYSNKDFINQKNKLVEKLYRFYLKNLNRKKLQNALLYSIIEHDVNVRFILEYYFHKMIINDKNKLSDKNIKKMESFKPMLKFIIEYNFYNESFKDINGCINFSFDEKNNFKLMSKNINYDNNVDIQYMSLEKVQNALLRSIVEQNVNYKFYLEFVYRSLISNDIIDKQNLLNTLVDNNLLINYILEFNSFEEYLNSPSFEKCLQKK